MKEQILDLWNFENACKQNNVRVGGSSGIDGVQTDALRDLQNVSQLSMRNDLKVARKSQSVKEVEIP